MKRMTLSAPDLVTTGRKADRQALMTPVPASIAAQWRSGKGVSFDVSKTIKAYSYYQDYLEAQV